MSIKTLSQRDPRWRDIKLGFGSTTIGDYGCTCTSLAMLAGLTPIEVNNRLKSVNGYAGKNKNLIIWSKINEAIPWLEFEWRGYGYEPERIKSAQEKNGICLVEVDFDGIVSTPNDRHWVAYKGNKKISDPWTWPVIGLEGTSKYPLWKGYSIINLTGDIPQQQEGDNMSLPANYPDIIKKSGNWDQVVREVLGINDRDPKDVSVDELKKRFEELKKQADKPAEIKEVIKEVPVEKIVEKEVIKEVPVEGSSLPKEIDGLKLKKIVYEQ